MWKVLYVLFILACTCMAKMLDEDLNPLFQQDVDDLLDGEPKKKMRGVRTYEVEEPKEKDNKTYHPYDKPDIINDIHLTYSQYREMILVRGGTFWMGTNFPESTTGEYPMREAAVKSFYLDKNPVINADYWAYRAKKRFVRTDAEVRGWSWVVDMFLNEETREYYSMAGSTGWAAVKRANWNAPEGPGSNLEGRWKHPVVHLSWYDAKQYCAFHGKRLPTEQEWEYAARAGAKGMAYPWGDAWERKRANVWQGAWPDKNTMVDGYGTTAPVDAYISQNLIGFYDLIGNVWEWSSSAYVERMVPAHLQTKMAVLKGGSFVDSVNGYINTAVRNGNRMGQSQDYTSANVGFRCAKTAPPKYDVRPADLELGRAAKAKAAGHNKPKKQPLRGKNVMFHRKDEL